ncbi:MAG: methylmalonyl-CoA mutase family protein [Polyangia bacterium]
MGFPEVTLADWRARVEKELKGTPFDKALVHTTAEGLRVEPLYTQASSIDVPKQGTRAALCAPADASTIDEQVQGGAEVLWLKDASALSLVAPSIPLVLDAAFADVALEGRSFSLHLDALGDPSRLAALLRRYPAARTAVVSSVAHHEAGADAADELALMLSTCAAYLRAMTATGLDASAALAGLSLLVPVGRDTFAELCKLRALRLCWDKLATACGSDAPAHIHAVSSSRTLTERDPWVNMLRVTTQVFAALLGGADVVTPATFDQVVGAGEALGRRVARNTLLVLRDESQLGRVVDPAAGSYYLDSFTDALAREAWQRFRVLEADGGVAAVAPGVLAKRFADSWERRRAKLATRKEAIVGVSEFANLTEAKLPRGVHASMGHRDAEVFEALRDRADALAVAKVDLVALGPLAEHAGRVGFAKGFFAIAGLKAATGQQAARVVCLCGSDERYAEEAAHAAHALKAGGARRVLLAGRPGALEASLREAGVDDFIYLGCDAPTILDRVLTEIQ